MSVTITATAAAHVQKCLQERGKGEGLRLNIKPSGCSGFSYVLDFADDIGSEDIVFEQHNVKVIVAPEAMDVLAGTEVDFVTKGLNSFFRFNNPNVKDECGCGESFNV
ncbi:Iron-binding apoprotein IscA [Oceanospirillum multiglobuliferum]|uniref:Iron-sulfur cluster assembly protein IscA n=2 Tax=Oceanospirillum multiglobuliferum TaxID=64969 RepID=A0A1T4M1A1_9GAMM|nr:iron-sulfur cluster assembly accessory protein [Oceanospirillum multiglobuliferum]OPX56282.1 iron-sulfur cluster assembly protein IscA [Oceanospirillum multiglobuliferum]SJZ60769.1 Iron-binding apoprotein IscA [Oceanospirillum multiglobuliferum]